MIKIIDIFSLVKKMNQGQNPQKLKKTKNKIIKKKKEAHR